MLASPRPGQRQVAPPLKARRGTTGALEDARLAAARRGTAAAADETQQQVWLLAYLRLAGHYSCVHSLRSTLHQEPDS